MGNNEALDKLSGLLRIRDEIKSVHKQLDNPKNKLGIIDTQYDGPGMPYITLSNELKIKFKEALYIIDQNLEEEILNAYDKYHQFMRRV